MSWDPVWETFFAEASLRRYPSEDLVRFVARKLYSAPDRSEIKILEVGSGTGAHLWYLAREGFAAYGIEGSPSAVEHSRRRLQAENLAADARVGDILQIADEYPAEFFDAVIDVGALQCNPMSAIETMIDQMERVLRPGGWIFADLVAAGTTGDGMGRQLEPGTYTNIKGTLFENIGVQHFFSRDEIARLFARFSDVEVNEWSRTVDHGSQIYRHWVVEGCRRE